MTDSGRRTHIKSNRLQRTLGILRIAGRKGLTNTSINAAATITSGEDIVYELLRYNRQIARQWMQNPNVNTAIETAGEGF